MSSTTTTTTTTGGLFIPYVFPSIDEGKIREVMNAYGTIKNIHFNPKVDADGRKYNQVFINFEEWNEKSETNKMLDELATNGKTHVYYDEKWYWIVLFNTSKRSKDDDANKENRPPNKVLAKSAPSTPTTAAAWTVVGAPKKAKSKKNFDIELGGGGGAAAAMEAEAESLIPVEDFSLVDADYVYKLEEDNKNLTAEIRRLIAQQENYMNLFKQQAMVIANLCPPAAATFNQNAF
jgi:hypothetical protein